jgi:hypothetical protein
VTLPIEIQDVVEVICKYQGLTAILTPCPHLTLSTCSLLRTSFISCLEWLATEVFICVIWAIFRRVHINSENIPLASSCLFSCTSAAPTRRILVKFGIENLNWIPSRNSEFVLHADLNTYQWRFLFSPIEHKNICIMYTVIPTCRPFL